MGDNHRHFKLYEKSPLYQLFVSLSIIVGFGFILLSVLLLAGMHFFDSNLFLVENLSATISGKDLAFLRYIVIVQDISLFVVPAIIILVLMQADHNIKLPDIKMPQIIDVVLVVVLAFCIFPITSFAGQLNSGMHLPEWLYGVEQWIIDKEENATRFIDLLIISDTFWVMILNLLIIAVIPAIGEELIFRGVFQKIFYNLFKSGHLAVFVTAVFFSAVHFQFFGFLPRLLLGLVFGYLFLWSGSLWLPVILHFVNNAVPVVGAFIHHWDSITVQSEVSLFRQLTWLPLPIIISLIILVYLRNKFKKEADSRLDRSAIAHTL